MTIASNDAGEYSYLSDNGEWLPAKTAIHPDTKEVMVFDGKGWQTIQQKSASGLKQLDDLARSIANGATFGWADEMSAKANELTGNGTYEENMAREAARNKQIPKSIA